MGMRAQAVGLVKCKQDLGIKAPAHAAAWQAAHVAQGAAAKTGQYRMVRGHGRNRFQRDAIQ